jgi:ribosomal-protein-alanine N-acetyltransferase
VSLVLRPAQPSDLPGLVAIENQCFTSPNWSDDDFLRYECCVAEVDGEIAGFLVSRELFAGNAHDGPQREILNVAVAPSFRRRGIATALIINELARPAEIFLEVRESNVAAQDLYRKLGFVEIGRRPKYYQSPTETAIVMNMK